MSLTTKISGYGIGAMPRGAGIAVGEHRKVLHVLVPRGGNFATIDTEADVVLHRSTAKVWREAEPAFLRR